MDNPTYHRLDGPAVVREDGYRQWRVDGKIHREDGPAGYYVNKAGEVLLSGNSDYYLDGKRYFDKHSWQAEVDRRNKPPAVKMTVAEIAAKLGHDVEVVKE